MQKLDILAFGAHPDDVELSCGGALLKHTAQGKKAGIIDLTKGELGTRGNVELRLQEAEKAAKILGVSLRENLGMADGFFKNDEAHQIAVIKKIRQYKPVIVLANALSDRHPDHGKAAKLVSVACFLSGLVKIETELDGTKQEAWRPKAIYHYIQEKYFNPDLVIDISNEFDDKMKAIKMYSSQFFNPESDEPQTAISSPNFMEFIKARHADFGRIINTGYAEGFIAERSIGAESFFDII